MSQSDQPHPPNEAVQRLLYLLQKDFAIDFAPSLASLPAQSALKVHIEFETSISPIVTQAQEVPNLRLVGNTHRP